MPEIKRYSIEQAREEAETLKPLAALVALKHLGFETGEALEYTKTGDEINIEKNDYAAANDLVEKLNELIDKKFVGKIDPQNSEVTKLPGAVDIQPFINDMEIVPTLEGRLLFSKEGHGRVRGPANLKEDKVAYFGFVQTEYGKLYVRLDVKDRGQAEYNLDEPVTVGIYAPFRFSFQRGGRGMWHAYIVDESSKNEDRSYPPKSAYIPWKTLMGALALQNNELEKLMEKNRKEISRTPYASDGDDDRLKLKRMAISRGVEDFKDWYYQRLFELGDK